MTKCTDPVFVVGCPRSGTTYLYHLLLSSGGFAVYRSEAHVFDLIGPKYNQLRRRHDVQRLLEAWLPGMLCERTGVDKEILRRRLLDECRSPADFLQIVMNCVAASQGVSRWAECTPENLLYLHEIKAQFPAARFLHIIRDGRDVALSLERQQWIRPLPVHRHASFVASLLYWRWIVNRGRLLGASMPECYLEVRYENLVTSPIGAIAEIANFIDHDMDYDRILQSAIGSVRAPNSSFEDGQSFAPVGRWKDRLSHDQQLVAAAVAGRLLNELGYETNEEVSSRWKSVAWKLIGKTYDAWFSTKDWAKKRAGLGRFIDGHLIEEREPIHCVPAGV